MTWCTCSTPARRRSPVPVRRPRAAPDPGLGAAARQWRAGAEADPVQPRRTGAGRGRGWLEHHRHLRGRPRRDGRPGDHHAVDRRRPVRVRLRPRRLPAGLRRRAEHRPERRHLLRRLPGRHGDRERPGGTRRSGRGLLAGRGGGSAFTANAGSGSIGRYAVRSTAPSPPSAARWSRTTRAPSRSTRASAGARNTCTSWPTGCRRSSATRSGPTGH